MENEEIIDKSYSIFKELLDEFNGEKGWTERWIITKEQFYTYFNKNEDN